MAICKYFLRGTCKFGNRCRNEHPQRGRSASSSWFNNYGYAGFENRSDDNDGHGRQRNNDYQNSGYNVDSGCSRDEHHYDARKKNRFLALHPQPSFPDSRSHQQQRGRAQSTTSQQSLSLDQKVDRTKKDNPGWETSRSWLRLVFAWYGNSARFQGFMEVGREVYKANGDGNTSTSVRGMQKSMETLSICFLLILIIALCFSKCM